MTFDLVRMGWPNTAAILALAVMPIVALATSGRGRTTAQVAADRTCGNLPDAGGVLGGRRRRRAGDRFGIDGRQGGQEKGAARRRRLVA